MRSLTVLLLTHNRPHSAWAAVDSVIRLQGRELFNVNLHILDNGSDIPLELPARYQQSESSMRIQLHRSAQNLLMAGKNVLETIAFSCPQRHQNDLVLHLDDDVVLDPNWLNAAVHAIDDAGLSACGSVEHMDGCLVFSGQTTLDIGERAIAGRKVNVWTWHWESVPAGDESVFLVEFAGHRALLVREEIARRFVHDPGYLIGGEDLDYSLCLRKGGGRLGIARDALILHRSNGEGEIEGFRTTDNVVASWSHFHSKWRFVRNNAAGEARESEEEWLLRFAR